ncbi:putative F-box domain-containing protein [Rosellinia necatrix]|uniref:Putative F-box domain-containing protein n=1 Tax=Rosellinia necatrix TaxID=77044 RepID=A0A1W2TIJ4_ROSNE|nr:putative F-box domain-containing protein [Rosellinia necatrix]
MLEKRKRAPTDDTSRSAAAKRSRRTVAPDLLSPLSDELLVRILSSLSLHDLLSLSSVSDRFYHLSGDSQIWKRLYYSRFVLPRALRLPGFRSGSARDGKLHYTSRRTIWADGRRGGWVDMRLGDHDDREARNWKRQYKLRHNWARGKCAVEELQLEDEPVLLDRGDSSKMLVKVLEGIAVTADATTGLRAWDLKSKQLVAQARLDDEDEDAPYALPSCLALDGQRLLREKSLDVAVGFTNGSFGTWRIYTEQRRVARRYRHEGSSNGELIGVAFLYPYLLTATESILISLYTFDIPPLPSTSLVHGEEVNANTEMKEGSSDRAMRGPSRGTSDEHNPPREDRGVASTASARKQVERNPAPYLLTSLRSHTSQPPLALSLRETIGGTVASIAYTFSTIRGWSLGIQELHIRPVGPASGPRPEVITTQLAYTIPVHRPLRHVSSPPLSPVRHQCSVVTSTGEPDPQDHADGPISLSYTHPYLLATMPDNTLILHLCTSGASSLSISPGIRLWGHTSGISDAEITSRGKAVSVSYRGEEIRVWELEGRTNGRSIEVRPTIRIADRDAESGGAIQEHLKHQWDDRRNWVGFDDEMVIVLKESSEGRGSLLVYDFT